MNVSQIAVPLIVLTALITIVAEIRRHIRLIYIFKPLTTLLIIAVALVGAFSGDGGSAGPGTFGLLVIVGLVFSFGGDVILMPPDSIPRFRGGLILFFLGHVSYIAAFWALGSWRLPDLLVGLLLLVIGIAYYRLLWPKLGSMKISVALYIVVISLMVSRAVSSLTTGRIGASRAVLVTVGAVLFFISDVILSANRFWRPWRYERISLAFYFSGQCCLALAVAG